MDEQLSTEALAQSSCSIARNPERAAAGWPPEPCRALAGGLIQEHDGRFDERCSGHGGELTQ